MSWTKSNDLKEPHNLFFPHRTISGHSETNPFHQAWRISNPLLHYNTQYYITMKA
jgi:hypothetical protein